MRMSARKASRGGEQCRRINEAGDLREKSFSFAVSHCVGRLMVLLCGVKIISYGGPGI